MPKQLDYICKDCHGNFEPVPNADSHLLWCPCCDYSLDPKDVDEVKRFTVPRDPNKRRKGA